MKTRVRPGLGFQWWSWWLPKGLLIENLSVPSCFPQGGGDERSFDVRSTLELYRYRGPISAGGPYDSTETARHRSVAVGDRRQREQLEPRLKDRRPVAWGDMRGPPRLHARAPSPDDDHDARAFMKQADAHFVAVIIVWIPSPSTRVRTSRNGSCAIKRCRSAGPR